MKSKHTPIVLTLLITALAFGSVLLATSGKTTAKPPSPKEVDKSLMEMDEKIAKVSVFLNKKAVFAEQETLAMAVREKLAEEVLLDKQDLAKLKEAGEQIGELHHEMRQLDNQIRSETFKNLPKVQQKQADERRDELLANATKLEAQAVGYVNAIEARNTDFVRLYMDDGTYDDELATADITKEDIVEFNEVLEALKTTFELLKSLGEAIWGFLKSLFSGGGDGPEGKGGGHTNGDSDSPDSQGQGDGPGGQSDTKRATPGDEVRPTGSGSHLGDGGGETGDNGGQTLHAAGDPDGVATQGLLNATTSELDIDLPIGQIPSNLGARSGLGPNEDIKVAFTRTDEGIVLTLVKTSVSPQTARNFTILKDQHGEQIIQVVDAGKAVNIVGVYMEGDTTTVSLKGVETINRNGLIKVAFDALGDVIRVEGLIAN